MHQGTQLLVDYGPLWNYNQPGNCIAQRGSTTPEAGKSTPEAKAGESTPDRAAKAGASSEDTEDDE